MSSETVLEAQTVALLRRLAREQDMRTRRARDEADDQAREMVRRARGEARVRVHQAVLDTRRELELAVARRKAAIDTRERRARQAMLRRLLDDAWQRLPSALEQRWACPDARVAWCRAACAQAVGSLLRLEQVAIELDPRWAGELDATVRACFAETKAAIEIAPVAGLGAGLRIRAGNACLDATVGGLVAARERIAAGLLAEVDRQLPGRGGGEAA
jgi:hypothetical protein